MREDTGLASFPREKICLFVDLACFKKQLGFKNKTKPSASQLDSGFLHKTVKRSKPPFQAACKYSKVVVKPRADSQIWQNSRTPETILALVVGPKLENAVAGGATSSSGCGWSEDARTLFPPR